MFGYEAEEIIDQSVHKLADADKHDQQRDFLGRSFKGEFSNPLKR
jgi:hypothetical protein